MDGQALYLSAPELGVVVEQANNGKAQIKAQALQQPQPGFPCPIDQGLPAFALAFVLAFDQDLAWS